jgi:hypothetical protein
MALNPTFASASVNPSQSIGSDASAPAQGALPTANQPQYTSPLNQPSAPDVSENAYQRYAGQQTLAGGATQQYGDWANSQVYGGIPMNYQPSPPPFIPQGINPYATNRGLPMPQNPNYMELPQAPYNNGKLRYDSYGSDSVMPQGYQQPQRNRAQGTEVNGQFVPTFSNPDGSYMSEGVMVNPQQPQAKPLQSFFEGPTKGQIPMGFNMVNGEMERIDGYQPQAPSNNEGGSYEYPQQPQSIPSQSFFEGPNAGRVPQGFQMVNGELVKMGLADGTGFNPAQPLAPMRQDYTNPSDFEGLTFAETDNFQNKPMFRYAPGTSREAQLRNEAPYMTRQNYINNLNNIRRPADSILGSTGGVQQPVQQPQVLTGVTSIPTSPLTPTATPTGTTPMATNPLSTYATTPTTGSTPAPTLNATPGASSSGNFGQGGVLPNVTTTQQQVTAAPSFYTDYLNQLATQGGQAAQNAQYVGAQPLQEQAFNLASQNVGNYQPTLQNAINLASSVGNTNLAQAIGDVGQANIARNLAPQATAGIVGSGQFGSKRGAQALGDVIANAELGLTAQQQQAMQQDMANRIAAAQQLGTLANSTQQLGLGDVNALSTLGQQQQTIAQNQQLFPMQQLANQSALLRGYTIPTSVSASQTGPGQQGQFQTSPLQQIMSVGTLLGALAKPSADYIDPKTGLLVKGTSAGGNMYSGIEDILKKLSGKFTGSTGSSGTNSTLNPTTGLPNGVPGGATVQPDGTYVDSGGTKYIVNDDGSVTTYNTNGTFERSDPSNYDENVSDLNYSNFDPNA